MGDINFKPASDQPTINFKPAAGETADADPTAGMDDESAAEVGAGEAGIHFLTANTAAPIAGGIAYLASGGDMDTAAAAQRAFTYEPRSKEGKGAVQPIGEAGAAVGHAVEEGAVNASNLLNPAYPFIGSENQESLKDTERDVFERTSTAAGALPVAGAVAKIGGAVRTASRVRAATEAANAAEHAPLADAQNHLQSRGVPVQGVPVEGTNVSRPATGTELSQGYNRAVLGHVGETGPEAAHPLEALPKARDRITGVMDDIGNRTNPQFDTELAGDLSQVQRSLPGRMSDSAAAPIHHNIEILTDAASKNNGTIPGQVLQEVNGNLRALESDPVLAQTAGEMREHLDDLVGRHATPEDVQALNTARQQYRNLKQVEGAVNTTTGDIDPKKLMTQLGAKKNRNQALYGQGDQALMTTARAGARVLPDMQEGLQNPGGQLSTADRVRIKLGNIAEGAATGWAGPIGGAVGEATGLAPALRGAVVKATGGSPAAVSVARGEAPTLGNRVAGGRMRGGPNMSPPSAAGNGISHTVEDGVHTVRSPNGETIGDETNDGGIVIRRSDTYGDAQGNNEGTNRIARMADEAHDNGGNAYSDYSLSPAENHIYQNKLPQRGYQVTRDPSAHINPETGNTITDDIRKPVYTVKPKAPDNRPLSEKFPGQRGGPKTAPKGEAPEGATLNIGHNVGDTTVHDRASVNAALQSVGADVASHTVLRPGDNTPNLHEPTSVVKLNKPLTESQGQKLNKALDQNAIAQKRDSGKGNMFVAPGAAEQAATEGWDKYNPDYFHEANGQTATQNNPVLAGMTPEERAQVRGQASQNLMDAFHGAPAEQEYAAAALAGAAKRGWYANSAHAIGNVFGPDAPRFAGLLAAMSPQVSVETNFHNAIRTFINWDKAGRPTDAAQIRKIMEDSSQRSAKNTGKSNVLDAWVGNAVRALTAEDPSAINMSGPKVHSFYSNLTGKVNEVTNDAWMAAFAKMDPGKLGGGLGAQGQVLKGSGYLALSAKVRNAAQMLTRMTGETWTPREVQETVWSWAKAAYEHADEVGDKTIPELVKEGKITDELINSTPDFHQLFSSPEHLGFLESSRYAGAAERLADWQKQGTESAAAGKARASAAKTLRPALLSASERLEGLRQERNNAGLEEAPF